MDIDTALAEIRATVARLDAAMDAGTTGTAEFAGDRVNLQDTLMGAVDWRNRGGYMPEGAVAIMRDAGRCNHLAWQHR